MADANRLLPFVRRRTTSSYVDDPAAGRIEIYVPTSELPFAGHPAVGTAWLLTELGLATTRLEVPAW